MLKYFFEFKLHLVHFKTQFTEATTITSTPSTVQTTKTTTTTELTTTNEFGSTLETTEYYPTEGKYLLFVCYVSTY